MKANWEKSVRGERFGWTHYHVGANTVGYMPDSDVYLVKTRKEAEKALADESRRWRHDGDETQWYVRTSGSAREGDIYLEPRGKYVSDHALATHLWWNRCDDLRCWQDMSASERHDYDVTDEMIAKWQGEIA